MIFYGPVSNSRGTLYQGKLPGLRALQGPRNGRSWIVKYGGGRTGGTWGAGPVTGWRELLGKRGGPERSWIGTAGGMGGRKYLQNYLHELGMCRCTGGSMGGGRGYRQGVVHPISFGMYNIRNGLNVGLESDLHGMY